MSKYLVEDDRSYLYAIPTIRMLQTSTLYGSIAAPTAVKLIVDDSKPCKQRANALKKPPRAFDLRKWFVTLVLNHSFLFCVCHLIAC